MPDLASILIPVHNCEAWVGAAIESALAQTWPNVEIIALDDASTDGSWDVLQRWQGRIRLERATRNSGQNVSRNVLTGMARGGWLIYLDADDELAPDAVAQKMACAAGADAVFGSIRLRYYEGPRLAAEKTVPAEDYAEPFSAAFFWQYPNTSAVMFRRDAVLEVGGWNERLQNCTDYGMYFPMLLAGKKFVAAPESWSVYRQWSPLQAVRIDPLRRTRTRLEIMWDAVLELESRKRLTPEILEVFSNAVFGVIRGLYGIEPAAALEQHAMLKAWNPAFQPSARYFSRAYRAGYGVLGFRASELFARATRFARTPPAGGDPFHLQTRSLRP